MGGDLIAHYRILRELGRGGQGQVFLAEDTRLRRRVALKVLRHFGPGSEEVFARFRREAEVASRLDHPSICAVYDAGIEQGVAWIAMRWVEGATIADDLASQRSGGTTNGDASVLNFDETTGAVTHTRSGGGTAAPPPLPDRDKIERLLTLFEETARALHVAHEAGIVHRDIKPGNVMVAKDGRPVLLDFGMARDETDDDASLTRSGDVFGTPAYMSPEQVLGKKTALDRRTDVWSLGATLFECLTLVRPFEAATRQALFAAICTKEPPRPRRLNPAISAELEVVLATALEKDRDRRYLTAQDFAEDLRRLRDHEPIRARQAGIALRALRWAQRNPTRAAALGATAVLVAVTTGLLSYGLGAAGRADVEAQLRAKTEAERDRSEVERRRLAQEAADRSLLVRLEDLGATFGTFFHAVKGEMAFEKFCRRHLAVWRDFGIDLEADSEAAILAKLHTTKARAAVVHRALLDDLYDLLFLLERPTGRAGGPMTPPPGAEPGPIPKPPLAELHARIESLLTKAEDDVWYRELDEIASAVRKSGGGERLERLDRFLDAGALSTRSAHDLLWLAGIVGTLPDGLERATTLLDAALEKSPEAFLLHVARGGLAMAGSVAKQEAPEQTLHHWRVAVALRPDSGIAWANLGSALGYSLAVLPRDEVTERRRRAAETRNALDRAILHAPDSALVWLIRGDLLRYFPADRSAAIEALERALELDPELSRAQEVLNSIPKKPNER